MADRPLAVRFSEETIERFDRIAATMSERAAGAKVSRARAIGVAMDRGIELLEAELAIRKKPKTRR